MFFFPFTAFSLFSVYKIKNVRQIIQKYNSRVTDYQKSQDLEILDPQGLLWKHYFKERQDFKTIYID